MARKLSNRAKRERRAAVGKVIENIAIGFACLTLAIFFVGAFAIYGNYIAMFGL